jgi:hypothetical protein
MCRLWGIAIVALPIFLGCARGGIGQVEGGPSTDDLVTYYSPRSIKILPFTKPRSFDDDAIPDGVGVSLQALDGAQDPVKAYGTFLFELYEFRPTLGNHRGNRIQDWQQNVFSLEDQKQFWSRVTSTYEFQLSWEGQPIPSQKKYILVASYQAPGGKRLFDELEFEFRVQREEILNALGGAQP